MNRYNHIPEGCVARKAFSQTCWHEVQSERYKTILIVQQRQITCYVICCSGKLVHSETLVKLLSNTTALLCSSPLHGRVPHTWEKNVFSAWEKMDLPPHTCLILVERRGTYRCSVGDDMHCDLQSDWYAKYFLVDHMIFCTVNSCYSITFQRTNVWVHYHVSKENTSKFIL